MSCKFAFSLAVALGLVLPLVSPTEAAIGEGALVGRDRQAESLDVEKAQYIYDDENYCWYDDGWEGPGWYWCGYNWDSGVGWGGGYGWNSWGGGLARRGFVGQEGRGQSGPLGGNLGGRVQGGVNNHLGGSIGGVLGGGHAGRGFPGGGGFRGGGGGFGGGGFHGGGGGGGRR